MTSEKDQSNPQTPLTKDQQITQLRQQYAAVSELLWESIRVLAPDAHEVTVLPQASNPLWQLAFLRAQGADGKPDPTGRMRICAATIPELTEQEKKKVVRFLKGTGVPIEDALKEFQLPHPVGYVETRIADRIKWVPTDPKSGPEGTWQPVAADVDLEAPENIVPFAK